MLVGRVIAIQAIDYPGCLLNPVRCILSDELTRLHRNQTVMYFSHQVVERVVAAQKLVLGVMSIISHLIKLLCLQVLGSHQRRAGTSRNS